MPAQCFVVGNVIGKHLRGCPQPTNERCHAQHGQPGVFALPCPAHLRADGVVEFVGIHRLVL